MIFSELFRPQSGTPKKSRMRTRIYMKQNNETPKPRSVAEKPKKDTAQARERNFEPSELIAAPKISRRPTRERHFTPREAPRGPAVRIERA